MESPDLRKMFRLDEGYKLTMYKCTAGKWTIGYGHNIQDNGISAAVAELMLKEDIEIASSICVRVFGKGLWERWSKNRQAGWINFAFNLGQTRLMEFRFTLRSALREDWPNVEKGLRGSKWFKQVGERAERVIAMIVREEFPYG